MSDNAEQAGTPPVTSGLHRSHIERRRNFYVRFTSGPDYEDAYLCIDDGEPDMLDFAIVSFNEARLFLTALDVAISEVCKEARQEERTKLIHGLSQIYNQVNVGIAKLCDDYLDKSGRLLGEVRDAAAVLADEQEKNQ